MNLWDWKVNKHTSYLRSPLFTWNLFNILIDKLSDLSWIVTIVKSNTWYKSMSFHRVYLLECLLWIWSSHYLRRGWHLRRHVLNELLLLLDKLLRDLLLLVRWYLLRNRRHLLLLIESLLVNVLLLTIWLSGSTSLSVITMLSSHLVPWLEVPL
jgi:hypothetical protein